MSTAKRVKISAATIAATAPCPGNSPDVPPGHHRHREPPIPPSQAARIRKVCDMRARVKAIGLDADAGDEIARLERRMRFKLARAGLWIITAPDHRAPFVSHDEQHVRAAWWHMCFAARGEDVLLAQGFTAPKRVNRRVDLRIVGRNGIAHALADNIIMRAARVYHLRAQIDDKVWEVIFRTRESAVAARDAVAAVCPRAQFEAGAAHGWMFGRELLADCEVGDALSTQKIVEWATRRQQTRQ